MDFDAILTRVGEIGVEVGFKVLAAVLLWFIGRWLIGVATGLVGKSLGAKGVESTVSKYLVSALSVLLNVALIVAILGYFGVETTTFAALLAGAGLAIGTAWGGLLAHFAAGVFLLVLRPFKAGDFVQAGDVTGTVVEIGLFVTSIDTLDNVRTIVGNNTIFSGKIQNFTENPTRRVELVAQLNHSVDYKQAIGVLQQRLAEIPNVATAPAPEVHILEFNLAGPVLSVRPYTHNDNYWQVYFDTNAAIKDAFGDAGYPVPETHYHIQRAA